MTKRLIQILILAASTLAITACSDDSPGDPCATLNPPPSCEAQNNENNLNNDNNVNNVNNVNNENNLNNDNNVNNVSCEPECSGETPRCDGGVCVACDTASDEGCGGLTPFCRVLEGNATCASCPGPESDEACACSDDGDCGRRQGQIGRCVDGKCEVQCEPDRADCDGDRSTGCEVLLGSRFSCGGCDNECPSAPNAVPICENQQCGIRCEPGYLNCDGDPTNGCESSIYSRDSCGTCAVTCDKSPGSEMFCTGSACQRLKVFKSHVGDGTIPVGGIHLAARADQAPVVQSVQTSYDETYFGQSFDGGGYRLTSFPLGSLTPNDYELNISQTVYTTLDPAGLSSGPNDWVTSAWRFEGALDFDLPGHASPVQFVSSGGGPDALLIQLSATGDARNVARFEIDGEDLYPPHLLSFYYRANRYVFVSYANAGGPASSLTIESSDSDYSTALTDNQPGVEVYGISLTDFAVESHTTIQRGSSAFPRSISSAGMGNLAVLIDYQGGSPATFAGKVLPRENEDAFWHTGIVEVDPTFQHIHYIDIGHLVGASFSKTSGFDYIVAGTATSDSISGHPLSLASNNASVQVLFRIRQDGTVVWLREFENLSIHDMKYSRDHSIYIAASIEGSEVLDEWTISPGTFGSVVASFSESGVTRWAAGVENPDGAGFVRPKISIPSDGVIYFFTRKNVRSLFLDFGPSAEHGLYRITENFISL